MKLIKFQKGETLVFAIVSLGVAIILLTIVISISRNAVLMTIRTSDADALKQVTTSVQYYAEKNKEALILNKKISGIGNPNKPTVQELIDQKYLTAEGVGVATPFGSEYKIKVDAQPNGSITGFAYLAGSILGTSSGIPDGRRACEIARKLGDIGFCSAEGNSAMIGNGTAQVPNPAGAVPASIAGYIFVPNS